MGKPLFLAPPLVMEIREFFLQNGARANWNQMMCQFAERSLFFTANSARYKKVSVAGKICERLQVAIIPASLHIRRLLQCCLSQARECCGCLRARCQVLSFGCG